MARRGRVKRPLFPPPRAAAGPTAPQSPPAAPDQPPAPTQPAAPAQPAEPQPTRVPPAADSPPAPMPLADHPLAGRLSADRPPADRPPAARPPAPSPPPLVQKAAVLESAAAPALYSLLEVAKHLDISPETLRAWNQRFAQLLGGDAAADAPRYNSADVAALLTVQALLAEGYTDEQVRASLMPRRIEPAPPPVALPPLTALTPHTDADSTGSAAEAGGPGSALALPTVLGDVLGAIAGSQQTVLNSQASMREMVSVVVQDNFNLKDENRKLRERMLELERALAEYQRREETRKERLESRMRGLEGTVAALQQQMAQFVQMQRAAQTKRRGWW